MVYLEGGKRYVVEESTVPEGYTDVTEDKDVIIDLSAYTSPEKAKDYKVITITLKTGPTPGSTWSSTSRAARIPTSRKC